MKKLRHAVVPVTAAMLLIALISGCEFTPRKDVDENGSVDVARKFVECARAGDLTCAASYWRKGDIENIEANRRESFAEYCKYYQSETYRLQYEGSDKGIYWVRFFGTDKGKTRAQLLFVDPPEHSKDGRWKLRESRWIVERNRAPVAEPDAGNSRPEPPPASTPP